MFEKLKNILGLNNARLLEWQKVLIPNQNKLSLTENQLKKITNEKAETLLKQLKESSVILQTTKEPLTFFSRLNLFYERLNDLKSIEPYLKFDSVKPSETLSAANFEKQAIIMDFLKRYTKSVIEKSNTLKTSKSKISQWQKYYDTLKQYSSYMSKECIEYYINMYNNNIRHSETDTQILEEIQNEKFFKGVNKLNSDGYSPWDNNPNPNDNYTNTIFLSIFDGKGKVLTNNPDDYPRWLEYELNVTNPIAKQNEVLNMGFIEKEDFKSAVSKLKVTELKELLNEYHIIPKGKKAELVELVVQNIKPELLENKLTYAYVTSSYGKEFLNKNQRYLEIRKLKRYEIKSDEFFRLEKEYSSELTIKEIAENIIKSRFQFFYNKQDYGLAQNEQLYYSYLCADNEDYSNCIKHLIILLYFDVSGVGNGASVEDIQHITLAPGIVNMIQQYKKYYTEDIIDECYKIYLPKVNLTKEEFKYLIDLILKNKQKTNLIKNFK